MYQIYFNDKVIILTNVQEFNRKIKYFPIDEFSIEQIVEYFHSSNHDKIYLYHSKQESLLKKFKKKISVIKAAGGVVVNCRGEYLFIKREGKWDLPKGKLEKKESPLQAALREVEEETGVGNLKIVKLRSVTYHIFKRNGKYKLKETYWYDMQTDFSGKPSAQKEENIEKAVWKKKTKIPKLMKNSYGNIKKLLFQELFDCHQVQSEK